MLENEILKTIKLAHYFNSAFTKSQVFQYLPVKVDKKEYNIVLQEMMDCGRIKVESEFLFADESDLNDYHPRIWSKNIFNNNKKYISLMAQIPWIKFIGLTGANAFESCKENDDLDIFVVTQPGRLWLTYLIIVVISKLFGIRQVFCVNYLIDENNMKIQHQSYYNAIQLLQMISVFNEQFRKKLISANEWIYDYLPNAEPGYKMNDFYLLNLSRENGGISQNSFLNAIDSGIYNKYSRHLEAKYKFLIGKNLILERGIAKLHRDDHQNIYNEINALEKSII